MILIDYYTLLLPLCPRILTKLRRTRSTTNINRSFVYCTFGLWHVQEGTQMWLTHRPLLTLKPTLNFLDVFKGNPMLTENSRRYSILFALRRQNYIAKRHRGISYLDSVFGQWWSVLVSEGAHCYLRRHPWIAHSRVDLCPATIRNTTW